jgi:hypothetical protein
MVVGAHLDHKSGIIDVILMACYHLALNAIVPLKA